MKKQIFKELLRNSIHQGGKSYDVSVFKTDADMKFKMTYQSYNAVERFNGEVWDGHKWNHLFNMLDLKEIPDTSSYIQDFPKRMIKCNDLIKKGLDFCKIILT